MSAKILFLDIETSPLVSYTWGLWDQNVGLNQVKQDWNILSFAAKWAGNPKVHYGDLSKAKDKTEDYDLLARLWQLLDEADILVWQNGDEFDAKKINARLIRQGFPPPSPYRTVDTLKLARRRFGFTSNKLEYMTNKLCTKYKKLTKRKFAGFDLWKECLAGNREAWSEMQKYNVRDVLSLEELYEKLAPWGTGINLDAYSNDEQIKCNCGSTKLQCRGYNYSNAGKYRRFQCRSCGAWGSFKKNLFSKEKRETLVKK